MTLLIETDESWQIAATFVAEHVKFSSLFTGVIRAIEASPRVLKTTSPEKLHMFAIDAARSIVKVSPTIKSSLYQYVLERDGEVDEREVTIETLLKACHPDELNLLLALSLFSRLVKKEVAPTEFSKLNTKLSVHTLLGAEVGGAVSSVGRAQGALLSGIRFLSFLLISKANPNNFKELRRRCIERNMLFDIKLEQKLFGFNHLQIAAAVISSLGFDVGKRAAFAFTSQDCTMLAPSGSIPGCDTEDILARRAVLLNVESLHTSGKFHELEGRREEYFPPAIADVITTAMKDLLYHGGKSIWPLVTKEEIPENVRLRLDIKLDPPGVVTPQGQRE